jgi:hypothetical protein
MVPGNVFLEDIAINSAGDVFVLALDNEHPVTGDSTIFKFTCGLRFFLPLRVRGGIK